MNDEKINLRTDGDEKILVNVVEDLVKDEVRSLIKTMDMCTCDQCFLDSCAIALNNLPPKYVTTTKGALLSQILTMQANYSTQIVFESMKALHFVKEHPRHR